MTTTHHNMPSRWFDSEVNDQRRDVPKSSNREGRERHPMTPGMALCADKRHYVNLTTAYRIT
jgi:hypothetical protein